MSIVENKGPLGWEFHAEGDRKHYVVLRRAGTLVNNMFTITTPTARLNDVALDRARMIGNKSRQYSHITKTGDCRLSCTCHTQTAKAIARAMVRELE
jgi:hypothetical protein